MSERAIDPDLELEVFQMALRGSTSRAIAAELAKKHHVRVSHTTVLNLLARVKREREEVADAVFSGTDDEHGTIPAAEQLRRIACGMREVAARAARTGQYAVALRALDRELEVVRLQLTAERSARKDELPMAVSAPIVAVSPVAEDAS